MGHFEWFKLNNIWVDDVGLEEIVVHYRLSCSCHSLQSNQLPCSPSWPYTYVYSLSSWSINSNYASSIFPYTISPRSYSKSVEPREHSGWSSGVTNYRRSNSIWNAKGQSALVFQSSESSRLVNGSSLSPTCAGSEMNRITLGVRWRSMTCQCIVLQYIWNEIYYTVLYYRTRNICCFGTSAMIDDIDMPGAVLGARINRW